MNRRNFISGGVVGLLGSLATATSAQAKTHADVPSDAHLRISANDEALGIEVPTCYGNPVQQPRSVVSTPCPRLVPAPSGSHRVTNEDASSFVCDGQFQVVAIDDPAPTCVVASVNLRHHGAYVSNIGYWYLKRGDDGEFPNLKLWNLKWLYAPYNNIPSAPFHEVGTGAGLDLSVDLWHNGARVETTNGIITVTAGNFYIPGTSQIGNSRPTGHIGRR